MTTKNVKRATYQLLHKTNLKGCIPSSSIINSCNHSTLFFQASYSNKPLLCHQKNVNVWQRLTFYQDATGKLHGDLEKSTLYRYSYWVPSKTMALSSLPTMNHIKKPTRATLQSLNEGGAQYLHVQY